MVTRMLGTFTEIWAIGRDAGLGEITTWKVAPLGSGSGGEAG